MPKSRNRKKHKAKVRQRKTAISHARNTYNKFMQMRMAMMQKAQEEANTKSETAVSEPVNTESTSAEPTTA